MYDRVFTHAHAQLCANVFACTPTHIHAYNHPHMCMRVCVYVCNCVHTDMQPDQQRDGQA